MGGSPKTATTTQSVQIPPEIMARYNRSNEAAEAAASQPFKAYSQDPNAFVAPLTQTQQTAMQNISQATGMSQPYTNAAAGMMMSGAQGVGPLTQQQIQNYQNPYTQSVVDATMAGLRQQQGQALSQQQGEAIRAGAFGGDRAGLQRTQLMGQQGLATAQAISPLYQRAYEQAVQTAAGQQGVQAADYQRMLAAGQQLGGLGAQAQRSAIEGAQAQFGMGTAEQQTQQAGLSALYNQFLQERGYPFQTAQFLANIATATGALSGNTTTTAQPIPFMSDEREKTNIQPLGKGMYAYDYKDDVAAAERGERAMPPKRVGPMAQDIEERAPGLVGEINGHKVVKGLSPESMGGAVVDLGPGEYRENYAQGGGLAALYAQFGSPYGPQQGITDGPYGGRAGYLKAGLSPPRSLAFKADTRQVKPVSTIMQEASRGAEQASSFANTFNPEKNPLAKGVQSGFNAARNYLEDLQNPPIKPNDVGVYGQIYARGGLVGYAEGGGVDDDKSPVEAYDTPGAGLGIPTEMRQHKMMEPGKPPGAPKSIMSDITDAAKVAASIYAMSDERMKSGMQQVGELYNGLPVYKYRMGDGPSQLGLSAQEAGGLHPEAVMKGDDGLLRLNYDRATRAYGGGLDPRQGYAQGGIPEAYRDYIEEASRETGIPARFLAAKIQQEGQFRPDARGAAGEIGMTQVLPSTARDPGFGVAPVDPETLRNDPREQILFGARYLAGRGRAAGVEDFNNPAQVAKALRAYNAGGDPRYVQNVFQHLPRFGGDDAAMAYAAQLRQGEGNRQIDSAAGAPTGLGRAAGASAAPAAAPQEERGLLASMLPAKFGTKTQANPKGEQFGGVGEFLTSRQFVQPLFEGLAGMASSPSLFAGPAVLQGLGAASRAYTGLEREMAGTAESAERAKLIEAQTEEAKAATSRNNVYVRDGVTLINYFDPKTGGYKTIRSYEYFDLPDDLRPNLSALDKQKVEAAAELDRRRAAEAKPPGQAPTGAATTTGVAQGSLEAPKPAGFEIKLSPEAVDAAKSEARELQRMQMGPDRTAQIAENARIVNEARKRRDDTLRVTSNLNDLAKPLASLAAGQQITPGALAKVQATVVNYINSALGRAGMDEYRIAQEGLTDYQLSEKAARILTEAKAANLDQRAVSALETLAQGLADPGKTKETAAEILASAYIDKQMALEEAKFTDMYSRSAGTGITVAKNASNVFRSQQGTRPEDFYRDRAALKDFLMQSIQSTDKNGRPVTRTLLSYLLQQNKDDPLQKRITADVINQRYGTDVARYFLSK